MMRCAATATLVRPPCLAAFPTFAETGIRFGHDEPGTRSDPGCGRGGRSMQTSSLLCEVIRYAEGVTIFVLAPRIGVRRILYSKNGGWSTDSTDPTQASKRVGDHFV